MPQSTSTASAAGRVSHVRWLICGLLFLATVIAYVDRSVLSFLEKTLQSVIPGLNSLTYAHIMVGFMIAYGIGLAVAGGLTDKLGTRRAFALAILLWSFAAMLPAFIASVHGFLVAMVLLGLAEAANFPACIRTVAEWFPQAERALATALFNSGANVGTMVVPFVVVFFTMRFGWRQAFLATGAMGFLWLFLWLWIYKKPEAHPGVSPAELRHIQSGHAESPAGIAWRHLLPVKETWAFAIGKFLTDPIWWFWLFWLPRYLEGTFHLKLGPTSIPFATVYLISIVGSIGAGWLPARFLRRGHTANWSRKITMLICALAVVPVIFAPYSHSLWVVVALVGLAAAAHQGWSANIFTIPSDVFPKTAVASVVGIGGLAGAIGGALFQELAGVVVHRTHSYLPLFAIACVIYLLALGIMHLLTPRLAPARLTVGD